ncbi:hypothetical protein DFP73DRAFT_346099 [Morchella snyderi]|nr:hypothetical protein DFP73DRAFT_346099 [Morchella snyderi]
MVHREELTARRRVLISPEICLVDGEELSTVESADLARLRGLNSRQSLLRYIYSPSYLDIRHLLPLRYHSPKHRNMRFAFIPLLLAPLAALASPVPITTPEGYTVTCYYDARAAMAVGISAILSANEDNDDVLEYPWEKMNFGAVLRANGDVKVKVSTAVKEARDYIVANCMLPDESADYGGLVDLGSHRVRLAAPGR